MTRPTLMLLTGLFTFGALASYAAADVVVLETGERLFGAVVERNDERVVLDHPVLGRLTLDAASVNQIIETSDAQPGDPADAAAEEAAVEAAPVEEAPQAPEVEGAPAWESRVGLGFGFSSGNTENSNLNLKFTTVRDTDETTTSFDAAYYFAEDDGETSENKATVGVNQDWKVPDSPWLYFARARYDYDEFNSWQSRITAAGGVGYMFIEEDDFTLTGRAGLGVAREYDSNRDEARLEGLLGIDLTWAIDEHQDFGLSSTYFPDFDESGEFRVVTTASWKLNLPQYEGASIFLGLLHEHQSLVDPGRDRNDLFVYGGLGIDF